MTRATKQKTSEVSDDLDYDTAVGSDSDDESYDEVESDLVVKCTEEREQTVENSQLLKFLATTHVKETLRTGLASRSKKGIRVQNASVELVKGYVMEVLLDLFAYSGLLVDTQRRKKALLKHILLSASRRRTVSMKQVDSAEQKRDNYRFVAAYLHAGQPLPTARELSNLVQEELRQKYPEDEEKKAKRLEEAQLKKTDPEEWLKRSNIKKVLSLKQSAPQVFARVEPALAKLGYVREPMAPSVALRALGIEDIRGLDAVKKSLRQNDVFGNKRRRASESTSKNPSKKTKKAESE